VKPSELLPTFGNVPADRAEALAVATGETLTARLLSPRRSISRLAGYMESHAPLFRETSANPQQSIFDIKDETQ
jgi:hypothetical protein